MEDITGRFEVTLSTPVDLSPDFPSSGVPACHLEIDGSRITIVPLKMTETVDYGDGDYESPQLTEIEVTIVKEAAVEGGGEPRLPRDEESKFESVLVDATRRFVTLAKHKTSQWDLDVRHPVHAYSSEYSRQGTPLSTSWPNREGTRSMPRYFVGTLIRNTREAYEELSSKTWDEIVETISTYSTPPYYDELVADSISFRLRSRYDSSVLYGAIAAELMLERACHILLRTDHNLSEDQCETITKRMNNPAKLDLLGKLAPDVRVDGKAVTKLFELRNKIAHGRSVDISWEDAVGSASTVEHIKRVLSSVLSPELPSR